MGNHTEDPKPSALSNARFRDTIFLENQLRSDIIHVDSPVITEHEKPTIVVWLTRVVVSFNKAKITVSCREASASGLCPAATFVYPEDQILPEERSRRAGQVLPWYCRLSRQTVLRATESPCLQPFWFFSQNRSFVFHTEVILSKRPFTNQAAPLDF